MQFGDLDLIISIFVFTVIVVCVFIVAGLLSELEILHTVAFMLAQNG